MYVIMEGLYSDYEDRPTYVIVSPEKGFKTEQEAVDWAYDNDYLDVALMKFERFL